LGIKTKQFCIYIELKELSKEIKETTKALKKFIKSGHLKKLKKRFSDIALHEMLDEVRVTFFQMAKLPFVTVTQAFHRFDSMEYRSALQEQVEIYLQKMKDSTTSSDEAEVVQPALRQFWADVMKAMAGYPRLRYLVENTEMIDQGWYWYREETNAAIGEGEGRIDHAILVKDSTFYCLTIEDKPLGSDLISNLSAAEISFTSQPVAQAFSQVKFVIKEMDEFFDYVPQEFVGLLQNGLEWVGILRTVVNGKTMYIFTKATTVSEIVALLEHTLCVTNEVCTEFLEPNLRRNKHADDADYFVLPLTEKNLKLKTRTANHGSNAY
jgi:hypothetical protein